MKILLLLYRFIQYVLRLFWKCCRICKILDLGFRNITISQMQNPRTRFEKFFSLKSLFVRRTVCTWDLELCHYLFVQTLNVLICPCLSLFRISAEATITNAKRSILGWDSNTYRHCDITVLVNHNGVKQMNIFPNFFSCLYLPIWVQVKKYIILFSHL